MNARHQSQELAQEVVPPNEQVHIDRLIERLRAKMISDYANRRTLRDAHPKMHGCVRGEFVVEENDEELRHGVFAEPRSYPVWIRFSNQNNEPKPDWQKDIRGVAIKLMGVEGEKLLIPDATTQDFILISHDNFVTKDVAEFDGLTAAVLKGLLGMLWFFFNPFNSHWRVFSNLMASLRRFGNPLDIEYFSVSPYRLGPHAVKYQLRPSAGRELSDAPREKPADDDYLRKSMVDTLSERGVSFDFSVQLQVDAEKMPIEDLSRTWPTELSAFRKVATLNVPQQEFDSDERREFGDNLSFNPWHSRPEHRPLGGVNRARKQVYQTLSTFRHGENHAEMREPTPADPS